MRTGIVYESDGNTSGEMFFSRVVKTIKSASLAFRITGIVLIVFGVAGVILIFWPLMSAEIKYSWWQSAVGKSLTRDTKLKPEVLTPADIALRESQPSWEVPDREFSLYIPKIYAKSKVIAEVDPYNKSTYLRALKQGVAEAAGLSNPGETGTVYLFAHSVGSQVDYARYNAVFYLLHKLEKGDGIELVYKNVLYKYHVDKREIIDANNVSYLQPQKTEERLILQTCYPPGTSWKRLIIVAKRV